MIYYYLLVLYRLRLSFAIVEVMIKTIIFDFYGVFQPDPYVNWLTKNDLQRTGVFDMLAKQLDHGEIDRDVFLDKLGEAVNRPVSYEEIFGKVPPELSKEVITIAQELKAKYSVGLLSNASRHLRQRLIDEEIITLFDEIVISSEVGVAKPQTEIYTIMLDTLQTTPEQTLYIDDNVTFVETGKRLGIKSLLFTTSTDLRNTLQQMNIL